MENVLLKTEDDWQVTIKFKDGSFNFRRCLLPTNKCCVSFTMRPSSMSCRAAMHSTWKITTAWLVYRYTVSVICLFVLILMIMYFTFATLPSSSLYIMKSDPKKQKQKQKSTVLMRQKHLSLSQTTGNSILSKMFNGTIIIEWWIQYFQDL